MQSMRTTRPARDKDRDRDWWRGAVIYQIYPRRVLDMPTADGSAYRVRPRVEHTPAALASTLVALNLEPRFSP